LKSWPYFFGAVVVVVDLAALGGLDATVTFRLQVVLIANLYVPDLVNGRWPPPPSPVWSVTASNGCPFLVEVSLNVPRFAPQLNVQSRYHFDGRATEERTLLPVPAFCR
jgi:hypothetical protein